jgi:hypothetical protein
MRQILVLSALTLLFNAAALAQKSERIEGNGKIITREIPISSFDQLEASGIYELRLSQDSKESVKIEADENLQEYFEVKNDGSKLVINMNKMKNKNLNTKKTMKVYVSFKTLKDLNLAVIGNIVSEEALSFSDVKMHNQNVGNVDLKLTANKITIDNHSVGNVTLSGKADDAVINNEGVGSLRAGDFIVQTVSIENKGVGSAEVNAEKGLKVKENFLGKVKNRGAAPAKHYGKQLI